MTVSEGSAGAGVVTYRRLVDGGLVYDDRHGCIHHFNETAALIWEAWQAGHDEARITRDLCARYEADAETVGAEVAAAIRRFAGELET